MVSKDWRETTTNGWTNDKNNDKIRIHHEDGGIYSFNVYDKNWKNKLIKNFAFHKGLVGATKYAKQYMKNH